MKPAFGTRRQLALFLVLLGVFLTLFIRWRSAPSEPVVTPPAATAHPRDRWLLRLWTPIPPPTPTPTWAPVTDMVGVWQPPTPPPPTPTPLPPAINFKFIGTFGPKENPFAVFLLNDQLFNARKGDVIYDQFILRRVGYESVDIGFVNRPVDEIRRLAIAP